MVSLETPSIIFSDNPTSYYHPIETAKRDYPNREIPPYPHNAMGDSMPYIIECKECGKLCWSLCSYDRVTGHTCSKCYRSSKESVIRYE